PVSRDDHAQALAELALDMRFYINSMQGKMNNSIDFRIGINSGSLIAGVIRKNKFQYDVWGDTVNIASRMESHGLAGKIQVTSATYQLLKDKYLFERRGMLEIKGKGEMETWFLEGRQ
ncbi:MAG: adenylate/guanylate cyclase domain-containing protein, partial [Anaerolineae bacterium]|nr:adenylate/guanylate cyclase domain-containing protein [Anaerolineae bacterium]